MFKNIRSFLAVRRLPLRTEAYLAQQPNRYNVQRVRFLQPFYTRRRAFKAVLYLFPVLGFWHFVLPVVLPEIEDEQEDATTSITAAVATKQGALDTGGVEPATEEEAQIQVNAEVPDEDAVFIPLGWTHKGTPKPYKATDPEWIEFAKFSRDQAKNSKVTLELAEMVYKIVQSNGDLVKMLGDPPKLHKYWLDIEYPPAPPAEYERSGVEITDDYISWTSRPVTAKNYNRLRHALWPTALSSSFLASYTALVKHNVDKVKDKLGVKTEDKDQNMRTPVKSKVESQSKTPSQYSGSTNHSTRSNAFDPPVRSPETESSTSGRQTSKLVSTRPKNDVLPPLPSIPETSPEMNTAVTAFKTTLSRKWRGPASLEPPRGTVLVSGLVEVVGPKAMMIVDVRAAYNPKNSKWEGLGMGVKKFRPRVMRPAA